MLAKRFWLLLVLVVLIAYGVAAQEATPTTASVTPQDLADPDGHFVEVNGASVYYREQGPAAGPRRAVVTRFPRLYG